MENKKVYVVPHSHWDAEWYFTCEDSHILLVENMKYLMALLETHPEFPSYTFDGLSIVLDDFLEICPDQKERLKKLIENRRILVGPWYTQTDTLLVRTESVIRNLVYGIRRAKELGHCMDIGYLPDVFGQHAYLPSIFKDLGLSYSILQRGVYTDEVKDDLNFKWQAPNGVQIPTNCLYYGYGPGKFLSNEETYVQHRLLPILKQLSDMNHTDHLLLPSGGDQVLANITFPETVKRLNERNLPFTFVMSDYESYMQDTWKDTSFDKVIEGELIACQKSRIHRTCHSTRCDMKQQTYRSEHLLLDQLEPLCVIADELQIEYPKAFLPTMWKKVFASHAHNGIEASNADQVNANVKNRLASVERSALAMISMLKKKIATAIAKHLQKENLLVVFHCDVRKGSHLVEAVIFTKTANFQIMKEGQVIPFSLVRQNQLDGGQRVVVTAQGEKLEKVEDYYRSELLLEIEPMHGLGYQTFTIEEGIQCQEKEREMPENIIHNAQYEIRLQNNHLILTDKKHNIQMNDFLQFCDCADYGDEFDFAPLANDIDISTMEFTFVAVEKAELFERMTLQSELKLPLNLAERKINTCTQSLSIMTTLELRKDETLLRVSHHIENGVKDHRLRVHLQVPHKNLSSSYADQGYTLLQRDSDNPYLAKWKELGFVEKPMPIYTMENIVALKDEHKFMGVLTKGIKEYEVLQNEHCLALTLYRSVGLLGRDDTAWRPGRASGINNKVVETPDAQMLCGMDFEYAIWFDENVTEKEIFQHIQWYRGDVMSYQLQQLNTFEERLERFSIPMPLLQAKENQIILRQENLNIFMSMCKPSDKGNGYILRLFNPTEEKQLVKIPGYRLYQCSLLEEVLDEQTQVWIVPKDYVTLAVRKESL